MAGSSKKIDKESLVCVNEMVAYLDAAWPHLAGNVALEIEEKLTYL